MNENNNDAPYRAGADEGPRSALRDAWLSTNVERRFRTTDLLRGAGRKSGPSFTFAEPTSTNVAKPPRAARSTQAKP